MTIEVGNVLWYPKMRTSSCSIEMCVESVLTVSENTDREDVRDARVAVDQHHRVQRGVVVTGVEPVGRQHVHPLDVRTLVTVP